MAGIGDIFGSGSIGEQFLLWNVGSQIGNAAMGPFLSALSAAIYRADPNVPMSPAEAADMVSREIITLPEGQHEAAGTGISNGKFLHMVRAAGHGPTVPMLLEMLRRGLISDTDHVNDRPSFLEALADTGMRLEWADPIAALGVQIPSVAEVMDAWLEGQIEEDEAHRRYIEAGGDPTWFQTSYDANGTAPTPDMLGTMANRGIIPWNGHGPGVVSFEQGFLEGPWRNKWREAMRKLQEYLPPPRTVTALEREGSITADQALKLYEQTGLSPELAKAYLVSAQHVKSTTEKTLAKDDILQLYRDKIIDEAKAVKLLEALKYTAETAALILRVSDTRRAVTAVNAAVTRIRTLFVSHKITKVAAKNALNALGIPAGQEEDLLALWDVESAANIRQLTEGQITAAWSYDILSQTEAVQELQLIGYTAHDAWTLLSIKNKGKLDNEPAKSPNPIGVLP